MRFVITRDTVNPPWLGIAIDPKTPGFQHPNQLPKGFRLSVSDPEKVRRIKEGQCAVIDDGSPTNNAAIAKIDAEVAAEIKRQEEATKRSIPKPKTDWARLAVWIALATLLAMVLIYFLT